MLCNISPPDVSFPVAIYVNLYQGGSGGSYEPHYCQPPMDIRPPFKSGKFVVSRYFGVEIAKMNFPWQMLVTGKYQVNV